MSQALKGKLEISHLISFYRQACPTNDDNIVKWLHLIPIRFTDLTMQKHILHVLCISRQHIDNPKNIPEKTHPKILCFPAKYDHELLFSLY